MKKKCQVLLLKDIEGHGRTGDVTAEAGGYVRNYLIPQGYAVIATPANLAMQAKLQEERRLLAENDRKEAESMQGKLQGLQLEIHVKVDPEGHMYGSVNVHDIQELVEKTSSIHLDKRQIVLKQPIRQVGVFALSFRLKEGVIAEGITLKVIPDQEIPVAAAT